ncbi:G patch domain and ankyrin repeat-containing protein 1 homolog [Phlebotomus argentipes]|uniref:G patch domain and ankyrin repeat-containing protein 1 homolog n=1 Tax=Phlebotomus argentipes TaxID=94469 RepID=UPI002892D73B|nr:G patch domain and ankyrin repeat-containing protein 1 homolog [Phlebotomus argentipes]
MHPNWKALATVDFKRKIFVRESEPSTSKHEEKTEKTREINCEYTGSEVKEFYEAVTQEVEKKDKEIEKLPKRKKVRQLVQKPFNRNVFFRAAVNNDTKILREMDFHKYVETVDDFGWTALMMAACEGAEDSFALLLEAGASVNACDGHGNSVESLARKKGHNSILQIVQEISNPQAVQEDTALEISPHFCEICRLEFKETSREEHETSTLHQFNRKSSISYQQRFPVSDSNRGCRIMLKQGWNKKDGLGPTGSGRLFPVKTVLRRGRTGFGIEQSPARVTHFGARDPDAVARRHRPVRERSRKDIQREFTNEKARERRFRQQLS